MTAEEKAKAYDEVREKIAIRFGSNVADEIFSQFEMSDDERIREALITFFQRFPYENIDAAGTNAKEAIAWLKSLRPQKKQELSKENEV